MHAQEGDPEAMAEPGLHAAQMSEGGGVDLEQSKCRVRDRRLGVGQVGEQRQPAEEVAGLEPDQGLLDRVADADLQRHAALGDQVDGVVGAVSRALGHLVTGGFGAPQAFYDDVMVAANRAGERYWQMPLVDDYVPDMDSWYGDLQNSGSSEGSLVKSGLFLREFVTRPWVHLDIGGTGYFRKALPFAARGATGVSHATLVELALTGARAG